MFPNSPYYGLFIKSPKDVLKRHIYKILKSYNFQTNNKGKTIRNHNWGYRSAIDMEKGFDCDYKFYKSF